MLMSKTKWRHHVSVYRRCVWPALMYCWDMVLIITVAVMIRFWLFSDSDQSYWWREVETLWFSQLSNHVMAGFTALTASTGPLLMLVVLSVVPTLVSQSCELYQTQRQRRQARLTRQNDTVDAEAAPRWLTMLRQAQPQDASLGSPMFILVSLVNKIAIQIIIILVFIPPLLPSLPLLEPPYHQIALFIMISVMTLLMLIREPKSRHIAYDNMYTYLLFIIPACAIWVFPFYLTLFFTLSTLWGGFCELLRHSLQGQFDVEKTKHPV